MKIDPSVKKETCRVAVGNSCLACMMLLVYMLIGRMNWRVTAGAALGVFSSVLNFFLMAFGVQKATEEMQDYIHPSDDKSEDSDDASNVPEAPEITAAKGKIRASYTGRMALTCLLAGTGVALPCFDSVASLLPLLFTRPIVSVLQAIDKKKESGSREKEKA